MLLIFTGLLASADLVFARYLKEMLTLDILPDLLELLWRGVIILTAAWLLAGGLTYALSRASASDDGEALEEAPGALPRVISLGFVEATTLLAAVDLLFLVFVWIQFTYLFGGQANVRVDGYTYAEYARRGFFELLTVSMLTLGLVLSLHWLTRRETGRQAHLFNGLSSLMIGLVLVILASAFQRLRLYEAAYGYTQLRLYSHVFMIWLAATSPAPTVPSTDEESTGPVESVQSITYPDDRAVLQIDQTGGIVFRAVERIPQVTLWSNGRVVFAAPDGVIREAYLDPSVVACLVHAATLLYELKDHYTAFLATHVPSTFFTVETERGRKTVDVYGMNLEQAVPGEQEHAALEKLRALYRVVVQALPAQAPMMQPDEVVVVAQPATGEATRDWPAKWVGHLRGAQAREAARLARVGPAPLFRLGGVVHQVTVVPVLPLLHLPGSEWPRGGLPRHPAATAYNAPGTPYRFVGVSRSEVASWYREAMSAKGWRLGGEDAERQVWVRDRFPRDPI